MSPQSPGYASADGQITQEYIDFYKPAARGGVAQVTIGNAPVDMAESKDETRYVDLSTDINLIPLSRFADMCHSFGCISSIEINHSGHGAVYEFTGRTPISSGARIIPLEYERAAAAGRDPVASVEMTIDKIHETQQKYIKAATRVQQAGFRMAMIHGAHTNLIGQFSSPHYNQRTDEYGGSLENRARFALEILEGVRKACGRNFVIEFRVSGDEFVPDGMHIEETVQYVQLLKEYVDIFHVSGGILSDNKYMQNWLPPTYAPYMVNVKNAGEIRKVLPPENKVTVVGAVMNVANANQILADGLADFVAFARPILADSEMPRKYALGKEEDHRPCLRCDYCLRRLMIPAVTACAVNPMVMHRTDYPLGFVPKADSTKRVAVVGGGPGGMQATLTLRERGHAVTLYEKEDHLGGSLIHASASDLKTDVKNYRDYLIGQVQKSGATILLNTKATAEDLEAQDFEALIIATGARPVIPRLEGTDKPHVHWAGDAELGKVTIGNKVVIVGAGSIGTECAISLARKGHNVTVVEMDSSTRQLLAATGDGGGLMLLDMLDETGVELLLSTKLDHITDTEVVCIDVNSNQEVSIPADTVLLALGMVSAKDTVEELHHAVPETEVYVIGDASKPGQIAEAVNSAFGAAVNI
jgi:2,4-dienoyl-CoA reductase-like NADH-dependent reductase (Old Yellow Enzyme family)/thioredoxin reductase